ncbi:UDP-forming cellulose synthase catalytic subunit [Paraburkholderia sp. UCT31]|uniref:UDP-forming cellulose synthase catalytic subunit n=1 Tax=Paraburkholderia sp. UCT31 TaxID=2615209 RepID=UPI0016566AE5|nr:UDP-forming cellulose synthase catalytic subunit [Paraburkholderia sp. UCT31]MBC8739779.1 UDP-forming cellulose synthase catalytic subunit [Paraburkholderia sp. UCT31]
MRFTLYKTAAFAALAGLIVLAVISVGVADPVANGLYLVGLFVLIVPVQAAAARPLLLTYSGFLVVRYIAWRFESFPIHSGILSALASAALLAAELYAMGIALLGYFVSSRLLERQPKPLPADDALLPFVDIYIPTYSEPLSVVAPTVFGAVEIDYPKDRFRVFVLDDGFPRARNAKSPEQAKELTERAEQLKALCARHGAVYLTRASNEHAKSGNLNAAMRNTSGELIAILDADHIPTEDFLRNTVGFFIDDTKTALVQTPHFFTNADPVEKNLGLFNQMPAENDLFYRVVQKGLDMWNTSFFCGSGAVVRREAILEVGGFSTDSITEDASTSVKLHQRGWRSVYFGRPMVAGLQPETISGFLIQRIRWGTGMMQILIKQNPWFIRGLTLGQRVSYFSVGLFWFFPFARLVTFVVPLLSIVFKLQMYPGGSENLVGYTLPYLVATLVTAERLNGRFRRIFSSELYETLQAFYMLPALISTFLRPSAPTFKVTPKGEKNDTDFLSEFRLPFYAIFVSSVVGMGWGIARMILEPESRVILIMAIVWLGINLFLSFGALGALFERAQRRARPRVDINEPVTLVTDAGEVEALLVDANELGLRVLVPAEVVLNRFAVKFRTHLLDAQTLKLASNNPSEYVALYSFHSPEEERAAVALAFSDSERWVQTWKRRESSSNFVKSLLGMLALSAKGAHAHARQLGREALNG